MPAEEYFTLISMTRSLYIGNLSFYTSENSLLELLGQCGLVKNLIMGTNRNNKKGIGFCLVDFQTRDSAAYAKDIFDGQIIDGRKVAVDWDLGFRPGRQFGRGKTTGCQVRDEIRLVEEVKDKDRPLPSTEQIEEFEAARRARSQSIEETKLDNSGIAHPEKRMRTEEESKRDLWSKENLALMTLF